MPELITVTEAAAAKITDLMLEQEKKSTEVGLRIYVQGGGCSGLTYTLDLEEAGVYAFLLPVSLAGKPFH